MREFFSTCERSRKCLYSCDLIALACFALLRSRSNCLSTESTGSTCDIAFVSVLLKITWVALIGKVGTCAALVDWSMICASPIGWGVTCAASLAGGWLVQHSLAGGWLAQHSLAGGWLVQHSLAGGWLVQHSLAGGWLVQHSLAGGWLVQHSLAGGWLVQHSLAGGWLVQHSLAGEWLAQHSSLCCLGNRQIDIGVCDSQVDEPDHNSILPTCFAGIISMSAREAERTWCTCGPSGCTDGLWKPSQNSIPADVRCHHTPGPGI